MRRFRSPILLAVSAALLLTASLAVSELATLRGAKAHDASAYLTRELGSPLSPAALVRSPARIHPALGGKLEIRNGGLKVTSGHDHLALRFVGDAKWSQYSHGVSRPTHFGRETISFGDNRVEESLLVNSHQGAKVWSWQLRTNLPARVTADGSVRFADSPLSIRPVAILDADGRDVTPKGARWSVRRHSLLLKLDDAHLPLPYVIDPIALVGACGPGAGDFAGCSVHTVNQKTDFLSSPFLRPSSVNVGDLMLAQISTRNNDAITAPAGWTAIGNRRTGTGIEQALYYRFATAADTATTTYSWSWTNAADGGGVVFAYSGVDSTNPFDVTPTDNTGNSSTATATGLTTTQNNDMLVAFYAATNNVTLAQNSGEGLTQQDTALSGGGNRIRVTAADGTLSTPGASGNKTAAVQNSQNWVAHLAALTPALASDGSGTMTGSISNVSASQTGRTITFTYTAATGGMLNGAVTVAVPSGWSAPSTTGSAAGYTTASTGTVSVASSTITVSNVTLAGGASMTITYGSTAGGGTGATATATTGAQTWQAQQKARSTGTLTNLASSPSVTVNAADGSGTMTGSISNVSASQTGRTITFTYTAATGGLSNGSVTLAVPSGWSAPSTTGSAAGYTTASAGTVSVAGSTITVSSLTLAAGSSMTITYGDTSGGGTGATATSSTGSQTWTTQEKSTANGSLTSIASSPSITVYAADGSGTMSSSISNVSASQTGRTITFTYTAATGGLSNSSVTLAVPSSWTAPSTTGANAGYTTASTGTLSVSGQTITVSSLTLAGGSTLTITYGSTSGGGPGATATSSTGSQTWTTQEKSTANGSLTSIASSPSITVYAADGSGTMSSSISNVSASQTGRTITFTYTAATGGLSNGSITLAVPSGWSAPSTTSNAAGYSTASTGTLAVAGSTITVSSLTLAGGSSMTITYGDTTGGGTGATATSSTGSQTWTTQEKSTSAGSLTTIASSPSITVNAADGSGTMSSSISNVSASQTGRTITFTYTAATGGISSGSLTLAVPSGWSAPSTTGSNAGYTTASTGTLSVAGSTITLSSLTLAGGSTLTITYGDTSGGGSGATATSSTGAQTWTTQEKSTSAGSLANIASQPSITVYAADGAGTMSGSISNVSASQTGRTITFTYTAAAGGLSNGTVTLAVPSGWSAPSTTSNAAGYSTASTGTLAVAGSTITVSNLTLAGGSSMTITYGDTSGGGSGATATSSTGSQTWTTQEKSTSAGSLTNIASQPSITVYATDGSGTMSGSISNVSASQTGRTITFTYTAATGGLSNGSVTLAVPSGWSAPSTTGANAGYATASTGTLAVAGSTITVSGLTLAGGSSMTITYGDTSGGGSGATATSSTGSQTWTTQEKSTSAGSLASISSSPSITVYAADGSGTMSSSIGNVSASQTGRTITFTYTAATGGLSNGSVTLPVPSGWSAPSTTGSAAGYSTASTGTLSVAGSTITVASLTLAGGSSMTITYGDTSGGGPGATATSSTGAQAWTTQEKSTSAGSLTNISSSPSITVYAADGSGTLTSGTSVVSASQTGRTITFTYTAPTGGISNGSVTLAVPSGWSAPSTTGSAAGYSTANTGTLSVAGSTITVASLTLAGGSSMTITYGDTSGGGPGATATSSTGSQTWTTQEKSTSAGSLTNISSSPSITVYAADGSGTLTSGTSVVSASQTGRTITFTYTAPTGGISNGSVTLAVPSGWSAPSTTASNAGYTTASSGSLSVAGSTITVSSLTLAAGNTLTITYGSTAGGGPGATATSSTGSQTWTTQEKSTSNGTLTNIASQPSITVYAADGSGTLTSGTTTVAIGSTGNTITFTYTAATGGISNGSVTLAVPSGWSAPSTTGSAAGYTTASSGTVSVTGGTITVSSLTVAAGNTITITYGSTAGGGPGATATSSAGAQTWQGQEKSTSAGSFTNLGSSPSITVLSADGSGTLTTPTGSVNTASTGNTITFTYTAATGGLAGGSVTLAVPSGWSAPSTTGSAAGYTTASGGSVSVSSQTITVSNLTVAGGGTFTITYGSTAGGGSGATAPTTAAAQTWQAQEKSSAGGTLTNLASSPAIAVNDTTPPTAPGLSFGSFTNASATGTTVYIRQGSAGGFTVTGTSSDPESGIDHLTFPSGLGSGWTGGGLDSSSPYTGVYTFSAAASAPAGNQDVTATNGWALTSSATSFTVVADTTAPSVTAPSVTAGYYTSPSVPVTKNGGSDGGSGVDFSTSVLERDEVALSNGSCGAFPGSWTTVTLVGGNDTSVVSGKCYRYREKLSDNVGNQGTSAASNTAKVDSSAPSSPTLAFGGLSANAYWDGSSTFYFRPSAGGTFTVTAASSDAESGIGSYTFGTLNSNGGANWGGSQSGDHFDYTFDGTTTAPSTARVVSTTNGAGTGSANATYSIAADSTAPSVTAPGVTAGYYTSLSVPVTKNGGSDGGSGVDSSTSVLQRDDASLSGGTCGGFSGTWTTVTLSAGNDTSVVNGHCYEYRERLSDHVGNQGTSGVSNVAKVDVQGPANSITLSSISPAGAALKVGSTVYYRGSAAGSFKLSNAVSDSESGPASSATASLGGTTTGWSHTASTVSTPAGGPYDSNTFSWNAGTSSSPTEVVTAADTAGNTTAAPALTFTNDSNAPTGGALTVNGGSAYSTTGSFSIDLRTDYSETQSATESGLASSTLTRAAASLTNNSCGSYGAPTTISGTPAQTLSTGCYLYTLTGVDNVGNTASISTTVKVDTSAPTNPSLSIANLTGGTYYSGSGTQVFFNPTAVSGGFDLSASSSDGDTGISGYTFPAAGAMGTGWSASGSGASRTYSFAMSAAEPGTKTVQATNNAGTSSSSNFTVTADSSAPTTLVQCNGVACLNGTYYTSSPVSVTLSASDGAGSGVQKIRYTTDGSVPTLVNGSDYSSALSINTTTTVKFRAYDNLGNAEAVSSQDVLLDGTPPNLSLTLTENPASGAQHVSGSTLYYRPGAAGTFRVAASADDPQTGVSSVDFPAIANVTGGGSQTSAPYREDYTWGASTSDSGAHNVVATNGAGSTTNSSFTLTPDSTAPAGQSITLNGANAPYFGSASVAFTLGDGSDGGSGLDTSSRSVTRETGTLSGDSCSGFTADPGTFSSPDTSVSGGHCYRYTFTIADNVGNVSTPVSVTAKVDTQAPSISVTPPTALSGTGNQYYSAGSHTLFFRSTGSGSFRLNATTSDTDTAVANVSYPDLSGLTGWSTSGTDSTWSSGAADPGTRTVTATDKAGNSAGDTITITGDSAAPTGQAITLTGAHAPYYNATSVSFSLTDGTDGSGVGIDTATRSVTRETGDLSGGACSNFTADGGTFSSPDTAVSGGHCYRYTFTIADRVGNVSSPVSVTAKVDTDAPSVAVTAPVELTGQGNQYYDAASHTQYFRPAGSGSFTLTGTASDPESGVAQVAFPDVSGVSGWSGSTGGADTTSPYASPVDYAWSAGASAPGAQAITATNGAAIDGSAAIAIAADSTAPSGQSISLTGAHAPYYGSASVSFTLGDGSDAGAGLDTSSRTITRETGTLSGDTCTGFTADAGTFTSPDTSVSSGHCYRYSFTIADRVGNVSTPVTATAKVDTQAPTVSVDAPTELTGAGNQYYDSGSKTLFFRSTGSGSFHLSSTSSDALTAVQTVTYPDLSGVGGWSTSGADDSWSSGAAEPGTRTITATDKAGNTGTDTLAITDDTAAPTGQTITLTGAGAPYYAADSVSFSLGNGTDAGAGLDTSSATVTRETGTLSGDSCSGFTADAGTFTSPDTSVSGGHCYRYSFSIADNVGNVSTAVTATAKVDTDNPSVTLTDPGTPLAGTVSLSASASDPSTAVQQVVFQRAPAGGTTWTTIGTDTTAPYTTSWNTGAVADGLYDLRAVATDIVGNARVDTVTNRRVDNTPPDTSIDSGPSDPSNDATPTFAFSSSETGSTFECRIDSGSWTACTSPHTTAALGEGSHTFDVRATDAAGNTDATPASTTWTVDLTAPNTTIDSAPPALDNDATPTFAFSSSEGGSTFECRIDGGSWTSCTSPHTTAALAEGSHTFDVRATDAAGNTDATPATYSWSIDLGPPTVTITAPTTYVNAADPSTYTVTASTPDADVTRVDFYECSNASTDCSTGSWSQFDTDSSAPYTGSWVTPGSDGKRAIRAVAVDAALNTGQAIRNITIDRTPPSGVTVSYANGYAFGSVPVTTGNGPDADVDASSAVLERQTGTLANDTCTSYGGWTTVTTPDTVASGLCAKYRYRVADNAGNWTTATSTNEVKSDTDAPTSTQDDPGAYLRGIVTLTSSASDSGGSGLASVAFQRRPAGGGAWTTIATDPTSPFSASFDTTAVTDGLYDFRTLGTDVAGNTETSPVVVANRRIDNTPPSATMLSPGNPVRGSVALTSNTSDAGSGLNTITYELAPHGGSFNTQPTPWDTTLGADGLYDLRVTATDNAGNSTTSALVTTRVDNTPPALTFSSPASGAIVSGTVSLTASASDASPASPAVSFAYKLHSDPPSAYTATGASWNTTTLPAGDGLYDLRARATDDASNTTTVENTSVRVDNIPPAVSITAPNPAINGSLPSPTSFSATATDTGGSGVAQVQFFECSDQSTDCTTGVWSPLGTVAAPGPYTVSWNIPGIDGNHALAAVATDNAGHPSSAIRNVNVDRTAPDTTIVGKPADPSSVASPVFTFTSSEPGSTFECRVDGGSFAPCTSPHTVTGLTDNAHTFEVRATDAAGNTDPSPATWSWHRDTTAPTATLDNPGANVRQTITLTSTENDPPANGYQSGIAAVSYEYSADGSTWATIGTNTTAPFDSLSWNTTAVADGVYQLRIVVLDNAGNQTSSVPVTGVRIDNTPPTTSQNDPGPYLRATKTLTASAADSGSGVDHVDFQVAPAGSGSWSTIATDSTPGDGFQVPFDTTTVSDGHYDFRTVAYDLAGNQAAATPVADRLVDNTPPTATLNDPGAYLRGAVHLTSSTSDPGGTNASGVVSVAYEYSTDGGTTWQPTGSTFDSTSVPDGNVELHVVATDAAGNSTVSAPLTKLVDNTKPHTTDNAPSGWQSSPVTVTLTPADTGSGVNVTEYSVDGNPSYTVGTSVVIPAPADGSNDGAHTIAYFSVDNAGNIETVRSATVLIDATPPACPSCSAADYLRGTVVLSASPAPDGSGIKSVAFEYTNAGGSTWTTIGTDTTGPAPYTASWDTTAVPDGHYDLRIRITDNANNVSTADLPDKVVDNTPPNVAAVGAPTEGQVVTGTVGITASASDATSPIASVQFLVRGTPLGTDTTAPFSLNWDTTSGADGAATIQVVVTDMAGNSTTSAVRNVTVDNVAPTPTLADPGQNLSGTVSLSASSDPDTVQVDFERRPAGGGSWVTIASDSTLPWGTSLDTTTLADGLYDFRAVATDSTGHVGTSPLRTNVRVDNTAPTGSLTAPTAGATVGGSSVALGVSVADSGSGVASVAYELRPTGGGAFTQIASSSTAPFGATWDATTVASGSYDLRPVITDAAGNVYTGAAVTFAVDVTAPTVVLANPGANVAGTVTLNATVTGSGATKVVFGATPSGGATWTDLGTDTSSPWSLAYDTTKLPDGLYDLRATVFDNLGNSSEDVVTGVRIDNTAPRVISSSPADGATVASATSVSLVTSEPTTPVGVTLDGGATVAPVVSGTTITYGTGALGIGPHTLAGEVQDAAGKKTAFRIHFTVYSSGAAPYVEKNTSATSATTVTAADGSATATMPAGAWSTSGNDWLVIRIQPVAAPTGLTNGFGPGPEALDVTAHWALAGTEVHQFSRPIEIVVHSSDTGVVPATYTGGAWQVIHRVPTAGTLPAGWDDGFFTDASGFHILTDHLSLFALLRDYEAPQPPQDVRAYTTPSGLVLRWLPGSDNSGTYDYVTVFSGSSEAGRYGTDYTAATIPGWTSGSSTVFRLQETDLAGNQSALTPPLIPVPSLVGLTLDQAETALTAHGFTVGTITSGGSGQPGTVTGPDGLALAEQGAAVDLTVASGGATTSLVFKVVTAPKFKPAARKRIAARLTVTRAARVTGELFSPRGRKLFTWHFNVRAGRTILKLRIPRQIRRPGIYRIRWTVSSGQDTATHTIRIRLVGRRAPFQRIEIVLSGTAAKSAGSSLGKRRPEIVAGEDPTFDAAANRNLDVRVLVIDVDELGIGVVRDLHTVFPSLKIVALAAGPHTMAASLKAGATIVLPRSTPPAMVAKVIQKLLTRR